MSEFCHDLRHIDLLTVYKQLQDGEQYWLEGDHSANIPPQFRATLEACFVETAEVVESIFEHPWEEVDPAELAIEVGDFIEDSIEILYREAAELLPHANDSTRDTLDKFSDLKFTNSYAAADYYQLNGILIYQYDFLCWLYEKEAFSEAFEMCEMIAETRCIIQNRYITSFSREQAKMAASERAKKLAVIRHAPTNELKTELLAEWDITSGEYKSRSDFSSIIGRRSGVKERTLYEWIAKHEKSK